MSVEFLKMQRGEDVVVRGKRVPMLEAHMRPGGGVLLVFDRRLGLSLDAGNYESVVDWVASVMENVMDPNCGRTFNRLHEVADIDTEPEPDGSGPFGF